MLGRIDLKGDSAYITLSFYSLIEHCTGQIALAPVWFGRKTPFSELVKAPRTNKPVSEGFL